MSDELTLAGVPAREDCPSCPENGERCALHKSMYLRALERQQESITVDQVQQAYHLRPDGHNEQQVSEQTKTSKTQAQEENRLKTQEGQMIKALKRMNFEESRRHHDLTQKQKKRARRREKAALQISDPIKIAEKQEKAARRAANPERIAKLEAHKQKVAENKARTQARRVRQMEQHKQHGKSSVLMDDIAEANEALEHATTYVRENDYVSSGPVIRTRGQIAARECHEKIQSLVLMHSMPEETGTDAFLTRADSLIDQTLASSSSALSPTDRKNLEEALSLVRTVQLLSSKDYRPQRISTGDEWADRAIRGMPIKQEHTSESSLNAQENGLGFNGRLRGGASPARGLSQSGETERDTMMD
ncbi:uncharacterized protein M437DRAFT_61669 [Aureobasidium melanogenum CBS 110374]|uniref:Uncharacterized protein n=1 Tax=Aureobasidium melanogenum (strain CBS 110374) TaxID=1043003 RepID=A0A074WBG7_AURM1|nr:uncharacterized protein M437DRAFT_61669 [Aureobasidium melanogenum CBS 110374]KEQ67242.1 hypothetical protein M437DRAFT_61669 [Aureobasidium melanogenum CBS 110374]